MRNAKIWTLMAALALMAAGGCEKKSEVAPSGGGEQPGGDAGKGPDDGGDARGPGPLGPLGGSILDAPTSGGGTIAGVISFEGEAPARPPIDMSAKPECKEHGGDGALADSLVVTKGKLRDVVVWVAKGLKDRYKPPATPVKLDQKGCMYVPHVMAVMLRQDFEIHNSDPFLHNVNCPTVGFNEQMSKVGDHVLKKAAFRKPGVEALACSVHPWMKSYAYVVDNPFSAVSAEDGTFEIQHVPPGKYTLSVWHENVRGLKAPADAEVEVKEGETAKVTFTFTFAR